jgi:beta-lactamase superfamily II metal-dependent hydrolase
MATLTVTAYNVGFGDAILVTIPDGTGRRTTTRHVLIDMGNVLRGEEGEADVFETVAKDILDQLDGKAIDLYVMSHEHLDHVRGMLTAHTRGLPIPVDYGWLTASAAEGYGKRYPDAARQKRMLVTEYRRVAALAGARGLRGSAPIDAFLANNNPDRTLDCVAYLRGMAQVKTSYIHREFRHRSGTHHPFTEARLRIWAPEADTSDYYGRFRPVTTDTRFPRRPAGVELAAYRALTKQLRTGLGASMLAIDKAANNTSVVFSIEWRGWRLLFPGDAEEKSWARIAERSRLQPVHLLKMGHHGSHNGTPRPVILDRLLPPVSPDGRPRHALLSTWPDTYPGVPDQATLTRIGERATVVSTRTVNLGESVSIAFEG